MHLRYGWISLAWALLVFATAGAQPPPLPEGLDRGPAARAPALPPGLESAEGPPLPEGIEPTPAPPLPPGLESAQPEEPPPADKKRLRLLDRLPPSLHGFWEIRAGARIHDDPAQSKDFILGESRLQLDADKHWKRATLEFTADVYGDAVDDGAALDLRQLRLTTSLLPNLDLRIGRQVLTWGTGDMLFINDLFPKDWPSFFSGRDTEYLKAPSDSIRLGWYANAINLEIVYTPQFAPDRFITGDRVSYWDPLIAGPAGEKRDVNYNAPSDWFEDDEFALRLYKTIGAYEIAVYGYFGFWKSPAGQRFPPFQATFPRLNVYGASVRGNIGKGIGNVEVGYYDSRQDRDGDDPFVNNSELRFLVGYEQELGREFTGAIQYYLEHMMDYRAYRNAIAARLIGEPRDEDRHVFTVRLTKLLNNQRATLSFFAYYSPSDNDAYFRPKFSYKLSDHWLVETGANLFVGSAPHTFFGQFEDASNLYAAVRFSF